MVGRFDLCRRGREEFIRVIVHAVWNGLFLLRRRGLQMTIIYHTISSDVRSTISCPWPAPVSTLDFRGG